jgi:hypothetical protein
MKKGNNMNTPNTDTISPLMAEAHQVIETAPEGYVEGQFVQTEEDLGTEQETVILHS